MEKLRKTVAMTCALGVIGLASATSVSSATAATTAYPDVPPETLVFDQADVKIDLLDSSTDDTTNSVVYSDTYSIDSEAASDADGNVSEGAGDGDAISLPAENSTTVGKKHHGIGAGRRPMGSGVNVGYTSASGCQRVTIHNYAHNVLGSVAYVYNTWTSWCWNRSTHVISSQHDGWYLSQVGSQQQWQGEVNYTHRFYAYHTGAAKSGYYHYRQGQFTNCVFRYGCVSTSYPTNRLWAHANGTWSWRTSGAA